MSAVVERVEQGTAVVIASPMQLLQTALERGASIEQMKQLMDLQERWEKGNARKAFDAAISAAKAEIKPIAKRRKVDFTSAANWALVDGRAKESAMHWFDQVWPGGGPEFGSTEEFDTFVSKHRGYSRYTNVIRRWQWINGSIVS